MSHAIASTLFLVHQWLATASNAWEASRTFFVLSSGWDGPQPSLFPMMSCCGDISAVTMIITPLSRSATPSLAQNVKPNCKPIRTKRIYCYHLSQRPNADLSLRPYATILVQINPNLQGCIIKAVLVLTAIPYQIPKILKIKGIEIRYPLYTCNPSYALVDHLLAPNRLVPIIC